MEEDIFDDICMNLNLKSYQYDKNDLLFINNYLNYKDVYITLFLNFNFDLNDKIKIKIFFENINL